MEIKIGGIMALPSGAVCRVLDLWYEYDPKTGSRQMARVTDGVETHNMRAWNLEPIPETLPGIDE